MGCRVAGLTGRPRRQRSALVGGALLFAMVAGACDQATPSPAATPAGDPDVAIDLIAWGIAFQPGAVTISAGTDFVVNLDNRDAGVPHNVVLLAGPNFSTTLAKGEIKAGPATMDLAVEGLIPGRYRLICEVHPNMIVELTVEP